MDVQIEVTWPLVAQLRAQGADPNKAEPYRKRLVAALDALPAAQLSRLHFELHVLRVQARERSLWAAASLWLGRWLDDGEFSDFRAWLIAHGAAVWRQVLADPDALVELTPRTDQQGRHHAALPPLNATPGKVYQKRVAHDEALDRRLRAEHEAWCAQLPDEGDDTALGWAYWSLPDGAELARRFPRLWAACGARWPAEQPDPFAAFLREVQIPGLGTVRIGDTLVSRHDGHSFVIEGLSDFMAGLRDPDDDPDADDDPAGSIIARVRHQDGTVACNQGLGRRYQRWPHEAATGPLPGDPPLGWEAFDAADADAQDDADFDAWEARDNAIQARLAAHIEGEMRVIYAAGPDDADDLPVDNLDDVAVKGLVQFIEVDPQDGERFESEVLESPTWLEVAVLANRMMCQLGYEDHVYLEGIEIVRRPKGKPKLAAFQLGS